MTSLFNVVVTDPVAWLRVSGGPLRGPLPCRGGQGPGGCWEEHLTQLGFMDLVGHEFA